MATRTRSLALAAACVLSLGTVVAQAAPTTTPITTRSDSLQTQVDKQELQRDKGQLDRDESKMRSDHRHGRMSAESADSMRVYRDRQAVRGERRDIAGDKLGSGQRRADKVALAEEKRQLRMDEALQRYESKEGRMSATSPDAERVYRDRQAVSGERRAVARDRMNKIKDDLK